jgi:hypothetical protein
MTDGPSGSIYCVFETRQKPIDRFQHLLLDLRRWNAWDRTRVSLATLQHGA